MTKCARCNRSLSNLESIKRGYGQVCWTKKQAEEEAVERKDWRGKEYCGPYDGGDIILERRDGTAFINVPHVIVRHSPTGFEWGYGGSGPADAALNILLAVTGGNLEITERHYQQFKWAFIAKIPEEGGAIKRDEILSWLRAREEESQCTSVLP